MAGLIARGNCATVYASSTEASDAASLASPRQKSMYLGGSGISWPVPLSLMNVKISFSGSQSSKDNRTFSQDYTGVS